MNSSFYNGISGVKTHQFGLDVWANNIANIDTIGFCGSTPEFSSLFSTALAGSYFDPTSNDKGLGAQSMTTGLNLTQGSLQNTDNPFDLAINGEGWFAVQGQGGQIYYTRAGEFSIDTEGNLVDAGGNYLMATSGNNITKTTLDQEKLDQLGKYYSTTKKPSLVPYAISPLGDVALGAVGGQTKVTLPDLLYLPPVPTSYVNYQANLNPQIITETAYSTIAANNNIVINTNYPTVSISGTLTNNTDIDNLKEGDTVVLTLSNEVNQTLEVKATLDEFLNFSIANIDIQKLDETAAISIAQDFKVIQEVPNVEHFTTDIIAPTGEKDILDMTFTKRVPQQALETIWDAELKILRFYEEYKIETYNPLIHDATTYDIDIDKGQAVKKYDPALYEVDTGQKRVYQIIDEKNGVATFGSGGQILSSTIPTLSNGGTPLSIGIGESYQQQSVAYSSAVLNGTNFIVSGKIASLSATEDGIQAGDYVAITMTDTDGKIISTSAKIAKDGTWSAIYGNYTLNTPTPTIETHVVLKTGFDGMISHVDLDKARIADKDGHIEGFLTDYGMDGYGNVIAEFSNGRSSAIAKVAVYHFQNDQGLIQASSTYFIPSDNSGEAIFYTNEKQIKELTKRNANAAAGSVISYTIPELQTILGSNIVSQKLESSNVNYATALTELIVMQKAFDASAKSITTSDQLIQNAINMKK